VLIELQNQENTVLPVLKTELKGVEKGIENILNAIQQGIITSSTKQRLDDLEARKADLEISIAQEQMQKPALTKEKIVFWMDRFRDGDIDNPKYRRNVIDIFVNSVYLYDDRMALQL
jgi:excinuclease UvrABC nuclease subunit